MAKVRIESQPTPSPEGQRIDVWLFRARLFKTRSLATKMVLKGKVRLTRNGKTQRITKPNTIFRPGDKALFARGESLIHIEMRGTADRRGPYSEASTLYKILPLDLSK